ncbi:MAG: acyl-CoA dehydrogenase [Candidatus Alcyoniella australis]|nr:acyl-CoA dehydrogenase [Candidatus Alcyoniella australis]
MSHYKVDERDVKFVLFEQLGIDKLCDLPAFAEHDPDMLKMVLDEALKLATNEVAVINEDSDKIGAKIEDGQVTSPPGTKQAFKTFAENGWVALDCDPEFGGQGMPYALKMATMEFFCGSCMAFTMYADLTHGAAHLIEAFGTDELKQTYVEKMYTGQWAGTMCLTEPQAGSDLAAIKTTAKREGDHFKIVGTKNFISCGDHDVTDNIVHLLLAHIEGAPQGTKGISLFVVPKYRLNDDGSLGDSNDVTTVSIEHKMGIKGSPTCVLNFGDEGSTVGYLLGEENRGLKYMFQMMNEARLYVGLQAASQAGTAYCNALEYARERIQFVHVSQMRNPEAKPVPIIEHPDVRQMLMFQKSMSEGLRALLLTVAYYIDMSRHAATEEERAKHKDLVDLMIPICKAYSSDQAFRVTESAIQTYGGYGYCSEYPVEQYARDTKICSIYEGTNGIQALDLVGRKLALKGGALFMTYMAQLAENIDKHKDHPLLSDAVARLDAARNTLSECVMLFGSKGKGKSAIYPVLCATSFLEMFGHLMVSHLLLWQASIAFEKLQAIYADKGIGEDAGERAAFLADHDDARYYDGKVKSALWFSTNILPRVGAIAETIKSDNTSALDIVF